MTATGKQVKAQAKVALAVGSTKSRSKVVKRPVPPNKHVDLHSVEKAARLRQAQERLLRIEEMRDAERLDRSGLSQREIADALHTTQPRVHRMLKAMAYRGSSEPSPEEVILRATVDGGDRQDLVERLSSWKYSFGTHAPEPFEGATTGSWDQVRAAAVGGLLSKEEFARVCAAVKPPTS